ncbi:MAG: RNA polymerase sigma factor [Thermoanaerobaculia bacterium]
MNFPLVIGELPSAGTRSASGAVTLMSEDEFRAFYERTARPLWSYLSRITGDRQQADDLLQEAYYRFYRAGRTHESEAHRRNSLFQIATNLARDVARRDKRHGEVQLVDEDDSPLPQPVSEVPHPDREIAVRTDLSRALTKLEPLQREMLWLAYAQGASHEEIGAILGVRAISVRTLLLRARRKLAKMLDGGAQ